MDYIDLRSDTVTVPSPAMREAMFKAEVGDDVYGEDPTVNRLQSLAAEMMQKESALFVASGTMGNLVALLTHCARGREVITGDRSHIVLHEQGGASALGGIILRTVRNEHDGTLPVDQIRDLICFDDDDHVAHTALICLENTWNGRVLKGSYTAEVSAMARKSNLKLHLDGARIFNAAIKQGKPVSELVKDFDTVQFCCSKGLAAPVGSLLCGSREFVKEAKRVRKMIGGGMRQAGVLAAACIVALQNMVERLQEDHDNAKVLAAGLANCPGLVICPESVDTNMVIFGFEEKLNMTPERMTERLAEHGVLMIPLDRRSVRAVTHYGIERKHIEVAIQAVNHVVREDSAVLSGGARK